LRKDSHGHEFHQAENLAIFFFGEGMDGVCGVPEKSFHIFVSKSLIKSEITLISAEILTNALKGFVLHVPKVLNFHGNHTEYIFKCNNTVFQ
jgi:hypothetical protein